MVIGSPGIPRKALAVLAILAAALTLLRPICEMWHAYAGSAAEVHVAWIAGASPDGVRMPPGQCCPYASDTSAAIAMQAALPASSSEMPLAPATMAFAVIAFVFLVRQPHWRRPIARTPPSFYLRSARIRR